MFLTNKGNHSTVKNKRPVNLNLLTIHFPLPAIVSILHRASGVLLFLLIPFLIWGLQTSLASAQDFDQLYLKLRAPFAKFVIWVLLSAFLYHFVAGIRHLLMDMSIGEGLQSGRLGAKVTMALSFILIILAGIWIW